MKTTLSVLGMTCTHCKQSVEGAIAALPGVLGVEVDLSSGEMTVRFEEGRVDEAQLKRAVEDAGFEVS